MSNAPVVINKTKSVCPVCFEPVEAAIVESENKIYLDKCCPAHGNFKMLISSHPDYYKKLSAYYLPLFPGNLRQHDYIIHLTNRCQLNCPICMANANLCGTIDYPQKELSKFLKGKKGYKFDLMGAEPTMREDLPEIIKMVEKSGNTSALHTNGVKIADFAYLKKLKKAGLRSVSLQFDGFDDLVYEKLRGQKLLEIKKQVLNNLRKANIATNLVVTVARGVNEQEMFKVLQFALQNKYIQGVFFLGYRFMGKARSLSAESCIMPDELIDILEKQSLGKISRKAIFNFQKLYFAFLAAFSIRRCFYIHHFLITRSKNGYSPVDKILNLESIQKKLEKFSRLKLAKSRLALPYFILSISLWLLGGNLIFWLNECFAIMFRRYKLANFHSKSILIGFISSCDAYSFDSEIARNCGKGTVTVDLGVQDSGAINNIMADKIFVSERNRRLNTPGDHFCV